MKSLNLQVTTFCPSSQKKRLSCNHRHKEARLLAMRSSTFFSFLFEDVLKCYIASENTENGSRETMPTGERDTVWQSHSIRPRVPRLNGTDIPNGMSWLTIHNSTGNTELTIDVGNLVAKIRKSNITEPLYDTASSLGTQCLNRWHRRDPQGKEGRIEC